MLKLIETLSDSLALNTRGKNDLVAEEQLGDTPDFSDRLLQLAQADEGEIYTEALNLTPAQTLTITPSTVLTETVESYQPAEMINVAETRGLHGGEVKVSTIESAELPTLPIDLDKDTLAPLPTDLPVEETPSPPSLGKVIDADSQSLPNNRFISANARTPTSASAVIISDKALIDPRTTTLVAETSEAASAPPQNQSVELIDSTRQAEPELTVPEEARLLADIDQMTETENAENRAQADPKRQAPNFRLLNTDTAHKEPAQNTLPETIQSEELAGKYELPAEGNNSNLPVDAPLPPLSNLAAPLEMQTARDAMEPVVTIGSNAPITAPASGPVAIQGASLVTSFAAPATITAAPEAIPDIVAEAVQSSESHKDRITVQLDPPELGRVSIDLKFDSLGLQTITVTGQTSEALQRLRLLHHELLQALEQHGLSQSDMSMDQDQAQRQPQQDIIFKLVEATPAPDAFAVSRSRPSAPAPTVLNSMTDGLNLRL